jgi:hypothetical protein
MVLYAKTDWRQARRMDRVSVDAVPILVWLVIPVVRPCDGRPRLLGLVGFGIAVQAISAFCYPRAGAMTGTACGTFDGRPS